MRGKHKGRAVRVYRYDPVCRKKVNKHRAYHIDHYRGEKFLTCCSECQAQYEKDRQHYREVARRLDNKSNKKRA